jgi:phosphoglycerol transferase MdoB-like AlkP superfamily enzyme
MVGIPRISILTGRFTGGFKTCLEMHKWNVSDIEDHGIRWDWDMTNYLLKSVIPSLEKMKEPWVFHWATIDTHPLPRFHVDRRCKNRVPGYGTLLRSFDCMDQMVEKLMAGLTTAQFWNRTEVIMYGDHTLLGKLGNRKMVGKRNMAMMLPTRPKGVVEKKMTIYDLGPTIMEILGVEYSPAFPFGVSMFSDEEGMLVEGKALDEILEFFQSGNWTI